MNEDISKILLTDFDAKSVLIEAFPKIIVDRDTQAIVWSNRKAEALFGCPFVGELIGEPFYVLMPERSRIRHETHWPEFWKAPAVRMMTDVPLPCRRRDGTEFPAQLLLAPAKAGVRVVCLVQFVPQGGLVEV